MTCDVIVYDINQDLDEVDEAGWAVEGEINTLFIYLFIEACSFAFSTRRHQRAKDFYLSINDYDVGQKQASGSSKK